MNNKIIGLSKINKKFGKFEFDIDILKFKLYDNENNIILYKSIDHETNCCEHFGFTFSDAIENVLNNSEILEIISSDNSYKDNIFNEPRGLIVTSIITNKGTCELTIYNEHNGYYYHNYNIEYGDVKLFGKL
jgi:hypothetical protein